jgi:hypothetical protein
MVEHRPPSLEEQLGIRAVFWVQVSRTFHDVQDSNTADLVGFLLEYGTASRYDGATHAMADKLWSINENSITNNLTSHTRSDGADLGSGYTASMTAQKSSVRTFIERSPSSPSVEVVLPLLKMIG